MIYERKLAKERSKDDHLYAGKDRFVTNAYKKKLAEQAKWMEEERLRQLREEKEDVTKKSDISDLYFNPQKNISYGAANVVEPRDPPKKLQSERQEKSVTDTFNNCPSLNSSNLSSQSAKTTEKHPHLQEEDRLDSSKTTPSDVGGRTSPPSLQDKTSSVPERPMHDEGEQQPKRDQ